MVGAHEADGFSDSSAYADTGGYAAQCQTPDALAATPSVTGLKSRFNDRASAEEEGTAEHTSVEKRL